MWRERFGRVLLVVIGAMLVGLGLSGLVAPAQLLAPLDITLGSPHAYGGVRAHYGGMELGLGVFLLAAAATPALRRPGLLVALAFVGGLVLGRTVSVLADGMPSGLGGRIFCTEIIGTVALLVALTGRK